MEPGGQPTHAVPSAATSVPPSHRSGTQSASVAAGARLRGCVPTGQAYAPGAHSDSVAAPGTAVVVPAGQSVQALAVVAPVMAL
jgi:hypothetical protein